MQATDVTKEGPCRVCPDGFSRRVLAGGSVDLMLSSIERGGQPFVFAVATVRRVTLAGNLRVEEGGQFRCGNAQRV